MAKKMKREEIGPFLKEIAEQFEAQLKEMGPAFKKKTREDLVAGFKDGARSVLNCLRDAGYLDVDASEAPGASTQV